MVLVTEVPMLAPIIIGTAVRTSKTENKEQRLNAKQKGSQSIYGLGSCLKTGQHSILLHIKIYFLIPYQRYCLISLCIKTEDEIF